MHGELDVGDVFRNAARAIATRVAAVLGDDALTFGDVDRTANRVARVVGALGVARGDRVAVWSGTSLDVVPLFAALAKTGAVFVPLNPSLSLEEAADVARAARPALVVVDGPRADAGEALANALGVPVASSDGVAGGGVGPGPGVSLAEQAHQSSDHDVATPGLSEDEPHVVFFTSGTTGRPKGVVLSHRVNYLRSHPGALLEPRGAMVCPYPLFHMGAWTIALQQWQARDAVVLLRSADGQDVAHAVHRHRAARLNAIPAVWRRIIEAGTANPALRFDSLRFADTGTSATPVELLEDIERLAPHAHIRVFYGSTEAGSVAALGHADIRRKPGSCGVPAPGAEVRVSDDDELLVRGPLVFDGYFDDPDATAEVLVGGWFRTGDTAEQDEEGYLTITGRVRDVIRTGGETVTPGEVEAVLAGHPAVDDVAVVGVPDDKWGEVVCAVVVVAPGRAVPTVEDLRAHCGDRLARYKHPRRVATVDAIPRTASTQQVRRRLLVEGLR